MHKSQPGINVFMAGHNQFMRALHSEKIDKNLFDIFHRSNQNTMNGIETLMGRSYKAAFIYHSLIFISHFHNEMRMEIK